MQKYFFNNPKKKYDILKNNVRLMKLKNKQAEEKINIKRNNIKAILKRYLYSQNDARSLYRIEREISGMCSMLGITALSMISSKLRRHHNHYM